MFNPFLIFYFILLFAFFVSVAVIIYHLQAYKFNHRISTFVTLLFIVGCLILLTINISIAMSIEWSELAIVF